MTMALVLASTTVVKEGFFLLSAGFLGGGFGWKKQNLSLLISSISARDTGKF